MKMVEFCRWPENFWNVHMLRNQMEGILKENFRALALRTRYEQRITQEKMAHALMMAPRSYAGIEDGSSMCGTLTAVLLLINLSDPAAFLQDLKHQMEMVYEREVLSI